MKTKWKITILALIVVVIIGGAAAYLFTIGPLGKPVIATVNGEKIPVALFRTSLEKIDPASRDLINETPQKLLDLIINRTLLLQQARKEGVTAPKEGNAASSTTGQDADDAIIVAYFDKKMAALPPVPNEMIDNIYEAYKDQMGGRKKEEAAVLIRQMLDQQRQNEEAGKLIDELRGKATIVVNQKELQKLTVAAPGLETQTEADFRKAVTGGKPMIVDFGSNTCIPCRQLRPVLQKVKNDYKGKLEVLIIDIRNNEKLANEYRIQIIPTVVFFDAAGKEIFRHQGFMTEEKIKEQLSKMGVV